MRMNPDMLKKLRTTHYVVVAKRVGVSVTSVYNHINQGECPIKYMEWYSQYTKSKQGKQDRLDQIQYLKYTEQLREYRAC